MSILGVHPVASAGHAVAAEDSFDCLIRQARSSTPSPSRGRADCLRFALPAEAIRGLDAWMLGGLEGQGLGEI